MSPLSLRLSELQHTRLFIERAQSRRKNHGESVREIETDRDHEGDLSRVPDAAGFVAFDAVPLTNSFVGPPAAT